MNYPNIIAASAGSGKTYTITEEIFKKIDNGSLLPNQLIATTFTIKSATELKGRIREKLIEEGKTKEANLMNEAIIGTINAVSLQLLQKYAFQAGISPAVQTLDENDQKVIIREFLGMFTDNKFLEIADKLYQAYNGFNVTIPKYINHIESIILRLRVNDLDRADLKSYGEKSVEEFFELYNGPIEKHEDQKANLLRLLNVIIEHLNAVEITAKGVREDFNKVKDTYRKIESNSFAWNDWSGLCKFKFSKKYLPQHLLEELKNAVGNFFNNDQFRADYTYYIQHCFKYAALIIEEYEKYKSERGLLDFADQEAKFYDLLQYNEAVKKDIQQQFKLVVVDEFQDVSPLQLSIFMKLTDIINENIWVGDPKQSIFAFRGADPRLMNGVMSEMPSTNISQLTKSYRSRKQLVDFANVIFSQAFNSMEDEKVVLETAEVATTNRDENEDHQLNIAVNYWELQGSGNRVDQRFEVIANQINQLIIDEVQVFDKEEKQYRAAKFGDIAILCRLNSTCNSLGKYLSKKGIPVGVSGFGVMIEPEIILTMALLKLIIYPKDTLAKAEVLLLTKFNGDQSAMINDRLTVENNRQWQQDNYYLKELTAIRERVFDYSPSKTLETILSDLNLEQLFATWGSLKQRISNTDALIRHANEYQETCNRLQMASSISGFLNWMLKLQASNEDTMGVQSGNVVQIMTYHLSKGLEWPIVLLWNLDHKLMDNFYGVNVVGPEKINIWNLLDQRELRLFVKPFYEKSAHDGFNNIVNTSSIKIAAVQDAIEEEKRLYYVAVTRARDYIIFCTYQASSSIEKGERKEFEIPNLVNPQILQNDIANDIDGTYTTNLTWHENELRVSIQHFVCESNPSREQGDDAIHQHYFDEKAGLKEYEKFKLNPSNSDPLLDASVLAIHQVNTRNPIHRDYDESAEFGTMIHNLICAFHIERGEANNCQMIENYFEVFGFQNVVEVDWMYHAIHQFYSFLKSEFDGIKIHRELPIQAITEEGNYVNGIVDMVLELDNEIIIIDHKTFIMPDYRESTYASKALSYSGQLHMYETILANSFNKKIKGSFIYFIFEGIMLEIGKKSIATAPKNIAQKIYSDQHKKKDNTFLQMLMNQKDKK